MEKLSSIIDLINTPLSNLLAIILLGTGLFFTITSKFVQVRLFKASIKEMLGTKKSNKAGITPFQAFVTGLASRVGVGNIAGVAIAIVIGGPGAVFWMWVTALIGMSSAIAESTLAQLFKTKDSNGQYRGGPAYYIQQGLKSRMFAVVFAVTLIFTYGFAFNAVQANTIAAATKEAWNWSPNLVGIILIVLVAPAIFGGIKRISKISSLIVPIMALFYIILAFYIMFANIEQLPAMFKLIFSSAFGFNAAAGGFIGAVVAQALVQGVQRGLFSNEAGMGSAPNAAAAADVAHPVSQGLIQMLGVFVDTIVVCTATACIILLSGLYESSGETGAQLTQLAIESQVGSWGKHFLAVLLFLFAFSSIMGNYAYAESNIVFIKDNKIVMLFFRLLVLVLVYVGSVQKISLVWNFADVSMSIMALINLIAILFLAPLAWILIKDYQNQLRQNIFPIFNINKYPKVAQRLSGKIWQEKLNNEKD